MEHTSVIPSPSPSLEVLGHIHGVDNRGPLVGQSQLL